MAQVNNYGAAPTYVKIASYTAPSAVASYTFSNIPQGYTDLILTINTGSNVSGENISLRFNSDSGSNYSVTEMYSGGSQRESNQARLRLQMGPGLNTTIYDNFIANIMSYSNTTTYKTLVSRHNVATGTYPGVGIMVGMWRNTAPITSIYLFLAGSSNFLSGSTFTIYGIKAALVPKATGGDIIVQDGTYWYHAFRTAGAFTPKQSLTSDVLVVAGGGGSARATGGGGAGQVLAYTSQSLTTQSYAITVGAGGASINNNSLTTPGGNGTSSQFGSLTAANPGNASTYYNAANFWPTGGTAGNGNTGGSPASNGAGGGGGQGGNGGNSSSTVGGAGGVGVNTYATWLAPTGLGVSGYIAGGGGGGLNNASTGVGGTGGSGGGGNGGGSDGLLAATAAAANTGSGAGGGSNNAPYGANGGSGLVIVRYAI